VLASIKSTKAEDNLGVLEGATGLDVRRQKITMREAVARRYGITVTASRPSPKRSKPPAPRR
jgi:hypothetical protein